MYYEYMNEPKRQTYSKHPGNIQSDQNILVLERMLMQSSASPEPAGDHYNPDLWLSAVTKISKQI